VNLRLLKARQTKYAAYATVYILIVLTILVIANFLANRHDKSYDTTANKRYSLSPQTDKIIKGLKQDATITYFDRGTHFQEGKDLLDQYTKLSPKVHVEYVDVIKQPQLARAAGVTNTGTAVVQIGDRKEQAKSLTEEGVTGAFIRDLKKNARTVCFVTGSGEHQIDQPGGGSYSELKNVLGKDEYTSKSINLLEKPEIPDDCTVLVVGGPTKDYQQPEVDAIKKYVESGGRALFMLDPPLKMGRSEIADNNALASLLQSWGVTPDKDLILDLSPVGQVLGLSQEVALVTTYGSQPIVNEMKGTATGFPLSRSLTIKNTDKTSVEKLFDSSRTSFGTTKLDSPKISIDDPNNKKGPLALAAAGTYNTGKEHSQGRFVVVGSSNWAANSALGFNGNSDLASNIVNWLSSDEDLISIRPKPPDERRVTMTTSQFTWVRNTSQFFLPLAIVIGGVAVWWRRR
jgi:ABC-type uncharacterized transport system involved in gliding motility auxiliary subunit